MNPSIAQAVKTLNNVNTFLDHLDIHDKDIIVIPVNNCEEQIEDNTFISQRENYRGSHWSTLIFHRRTGKFYHYDSSKNINICHAQVIALKLSKYMNVHPADVENVPGPVQENSYDCGIYVIFATEHILMNAHKTNFFENLYFPPFNELDCLKKRTYMAFVLNRGFLIRKNVLLSLIKPHDDLPYKTFRRQSEDLTAQEEKSEVMEENKRLKEKIKELEIFYKNGNGLPLRSSDFENSLSDIESSLSEAESSNIPQTNNKRPRNPCLKKTINHKINKPSVTTLPRKRNSVTLVADSQGKDIMNYVHILSSGKYNTFGHVQPGANFQTILYSAVSSSSFKSYNENDWLIFIAGSNDAANYKNKDHSPLIEHLIEGLEDLINKCYHTNLIIATIPYRYDLHCDDPNQTLVSEINREIRRLVNKHPAVKLLDLYLLERHYHTKHGFHTNRKGKISVSKQVFDQISRTTNSKRTSGPKSELPIELLDMDKPQILKKYQTDNPKSGKCTETKPSTPQSSINYKSNSSSPFFGFDSTITTDKQPPRALEQSIAAEWTSSLERNVLDEILHRDQPSLQHSPSFTATALVSPEIEENRESGSSNTDFSENSKDPTPNQLP